MLVRESFFPLLILGTVLIFCGSHSLMHPASEPIVDASQQHDDAESRTMLVILGHDEDRVAGPRVRRARAFLDAHQRSVAVTVSGNTKEKGATTLGKESLSIGRSLRGTSDGASYALYRELAANNTAQNLVCSAALWTLQGALHAHDPVYLITSKFACPRLAAMLTIACHNATFHASAKNASLLTELHAVRDSFCASARRSVATIASDDPPDVKWRAADEKERHMPNAARDLLEARQGLQSGHCHIPPITSCA